MKWELVSQVTTLLANMAVIVGVIIALLQLNKMRISNETQKKGIEIDHDRRKKQVTIEFFSYIYEQRMPFEDAIDKIAGKDEPITHKMIEDNPELYNNLRRYMQLLERIAVGIHADVYDLDIFSAIANQATVNVYDRLVTYINEERSRRSNPDVYIEFEKLVDKLKALKQQDKPTKAEQSKVMDFSER